MKIRSFIMLLAVNVCNHSLAMSNKYLGICTFNNQWRNNEAVLLTQLSFNPLTHQQEAMPVGSINELHILAGPQADLLKPGTIIAFEVGTQNVHFLDKKQACRYNDETKKFEEVSPHIIMKNNYVDSLREAAALFSKKIVQGNPVFQGLSFIGCARSIGCLVWALGTPMLTSQYLCWYLMIGAGSSMVGAASYTELKNRRIF